MKSTSSGIVISRIKSVMNVMAPLSTPDQQRHVLAVGLVELLRHLGGSRPNLTVIYQDPGHPGRAWLLAAHGLSSFRFAVRSTRSIPRSRRTVQPSPISSAVPLRLDWASRSTASVRSAESQLSVRSLRQPAADHAPLNRQRLRPQRRRREPSTRVDSLPQKPDRNRLERAVILGGKGRVARQRGLRSREIRSPAPEAPHGARRCAATSYRCSTGPRSAPNPASRRRPR